MDMKENLRYYNTLFLDRDGTINKRLYGHYVKEPSEFEFLPGALEAMYRFAEWFDRIIILTNQQGIGKGLMTHEDLAHVHNYMTETITNAYGRVDQIYYCPHLSAFNPFCRKPNPGMALEAKKDFPELNFEHSVIIGDTDSDIELGKLLNMFTVRIGGNGAPMNTKADYTVKSIFEFSKLLP